MGVAAAWGQAALPGLGWANVWRLAKTECLPHSGIYWYVWARVSVESGSCVRASLRDRSLNGEGALEAEKLMRCAEVGVFAECCLLRRGYEGQGGLEVRAPGALRNAVMGGG